MQCFGDIAAAITGHFETYLSVVAQVLQQAATVTASPDGSYELYDYVISLREGIMDAWSGIIGAMKVSGKSKLPSNSYLIQINVDIRPQHKSSKSTSAPFLSFSISFPRI